MKLKDTAEYKIGLVGENIVFGCLKRGGMSVIATRDFSTAYDTAPRMHHGCFGSVMPDFLAFRDGVGRWVDVKTKTNSNLHRITNRVEHGIDLRHVEHYQAVQHETAFPVWILVYERVSREMMGQRLDVLMETARIDDSGGYDTLANFLREAFLPIPYQHPRCLDFLWE